MNNKGNEIELKIHSDLLPIVEKRSFWSRIAIDILVLIALWGVVAYICQLKYGLGVTNMRDYVSWGLYIANFVFFIGISHAGTLISGILRLTGVVWRTPITRLAEAITVAAIFFGGLMPVIDMGRPDRMHHILLFGRIQSPILWDIFSITTYFLGCIIFLYLPMIPDFALLRDSKISIPNWKRYIAKLLSLGWQNTFEQKRLLERCMNVMTIIIIPVAVSVHTVVSWIFAMTLRPGWNSTIFGPYFVIGAIMSGCAAVIIAMAAFRKAYHLEEYITLKHFRYLATLLLTVILIYMYINVNEYWTPSYKMTKSESSLLTDLFYGSYSTIFWAAQIVGVFIPILLLVLPWTRRSIFWIVVAAILNVVMAWVKRYIIVVPTLMHPFLPIQRLPDAWASYFPSLVEWSITFGTLAGFILVYIGISRLCPIISVWETVDAVKEQGEEKVGLNFVDGQNGQQISSKKIGIGSSV